MSPDIILTRAHLHSTKITSGDKGHAAITLHVPLGREFDDHVALLAALQSVPHSLELTITETNVQQSLSAPKGATP